jgi:Na+/H+-dicarboxylate symporter
MLPAYLTGLSICSSSAVIPVTLECCRKNGIDKDVCNFAVPLCANVHMVGSATKLLSGAVAISLIYDQALPLAQVVNFTFMMAIAAVAAPGVMCGVLMASVGLVESILGFNAEQIALLITFYSALDGYGPAANVTGDGAIVVIINKFFGKKESAIVQA